MNELTSGAGVKEWLEATKGKRILSYFPGDPFQDTTEASPNTETDFTKDDFLNTLGKVSTPVQRDEEKNQT
ncbi:hypothetical protein ANRL1_04835 [Anaerolineae bacterium]|nr:hypothetical protein ANRL1_04835 [Anaerolineae bacterium]